MGIGARKSVKLVLYFMFIMLCSRILFILYHWCRGSVEKKNKSDRVMPFPSWKLKEFLFTFSEIDSSGKRKDLTCLYDRKCL